MKNTLLKVIDLINEFMNEPENLLENNRSTSKGRLRLADFDSLPLKEMRIVTSDTFAIPKHEEQSIDGSRRRETFSCNYRYLKTRARVRLPPPPPAFARERTERGKDGVIHSLPDFPQQAISMYFTFVLDSLSKPGERYIGHTSDLKRRLKEHSASYGPQAEKR